MIIINFSYLGIGFNLFYFCYKNLTTLLPMPDTSVQGKSTNNLVLALRHFHKKAVNAVHPRHFETGSAPAYTSQEKV